MKSPIWYRILLAVWGLWFTAALSEVGGLASCPMHGSHAAHAGAHAVAGNRASAASAHLAHATAGVARRGPVEHHHAPQRGEICTCLGQVCCAPLVVGPSTAVEFPRAVVFDVADPAYRETAVHSAQREFAHPYANGPPGVVSL